MTEELVTAPAVAQLIVNALNRMDWARGVGQTAYGGDRDYNEVLGYPASITIPDYLDRYQRQDIAGRIVDLPAMDSWKKSPRISENDDTETEFVKAWEALTTRLKTWSVLSRADRLSGIGRFGIVLIGFKDGEEDSSQPVNASSVSSQKDVLFLRPYSEDRVKIKTFETDAQDPRFGMPVMYEVKISDDDKDKIAIHWQRVLHIADNKLDTEIFGVPRLRPVYNLLNDLMKIVGGTAEATWLNMRPGIMISPKEDYNWDDDADAETQFLEEVQRYAHDPLRMMRLVGLQAQEMGTAQVMDPAGPFDVTLSLISAATGIPQRVLTGSSAGELASAKEDTRTWAQSISNRQTNYVEPEILRPFIDRLQGFGALPTPAGGIGAYDVGNLDPDGSWSWPSIIELSELERAEAVQHQAQATKLLADPTSLTLPITTEESRVLLGYPTPETVEGEEPELVEASSVLALALMNYRQGNIDADTLARFAITEMAEMDELFGENAVERATRRLMELSVNGQ